ncbi:neurotensin/neuromedin N [Anas platyrhynchos]|uniref:Neurotensin/neuromedin N n=3 Tax=Anas TaxID=8835 RepID=A0A493U0J7_ANAPP|eukprot:XP_005018455.2 neurotensin/neuromedin N [Anas platyrhynchos]
MEFMFPAAVPAALPVVRVPPSLRGKLKGLKQHSKRRPHEAQHPARAESGAARMRAQLVCVVLLALASCSLCSDSEEEMKALEADLLTNMYTSKINRAKLPYWKMTLLNVCNLVNNMNNQVGETVEADEDLISGRQFPAGLDGFSLEAMLTVYQLQKVCHSRAFQHWELLQQDAYDLENSSQEKEIMKRKNPYILKRQLHVNKARRPYILKRSSYY